MKIGIVTYHKACSYGACLQAYATFRVLTKLGHDVEMIDYTNKYEQRIKKVFFSSDGTIKSLLLNSIKSIVFRRHKLLKKAFGSFSNNYKLTNESYNSVTQMHKLEYDILVVGSDQVWNPYVTKELDSVYLLDFGNAKKRISISSSFGSYELNEYEKSVFKDALDKFDRISVRENHALKQLQNIGFNNIQVNCDPTLLLNNVEWDDFLKPYKGKDYILTFFVSDTFNSFYDKVVEIKQSISGKVYNIQSSAFKWRGVDKILVGLSPEEFLGVVKNAKFIITDSFHGAVFSILFHKQFTVISNVNNPVRTNELLGKLNLLECMYKGNINYLSDNKYESVDRIISSWKESTEEWIKESI